MRHVQLKYTDNNGKIYYKIEIYIIVSSIIYITQILMN
jgi:hypothetical protein